MGNIEDLKKIMLNISNPCTLHCTYCPHKYGWYNKDEDSDFMNIDTFNKVLIRIEELTNKFTGIVSISGFGEPLLNPYIYKMIDLLNESQLRYIIITNGLPKDNNGDYKLEKLVDKCFYKSIQVSIHEDEAYPNIDEKKKLLDRVENIKDKIIIRNHDINSQDCSLVPNNRTGLVETKDNIIYTFKECYYPFYEIAIDYDGSYLLCNNDFERKSYDSEMNIYKHSIKDYFIDYLMMIKVGFVDKFAIIDTIDEYGETIKKSRYPIRYAIPCCRNCNCNGTLQFKEIYDKYVKYVKENRH